MSSLRGFAACMNAVATRGEGTGAELGSADANAVLHNGLAEYEAAVDAARQPLSTTIWAS